MKHLRTFLLLLAFVFTAPNVFSQDVSLGIEGGLNIANISTTPSFSTNTRTGFMVGGFADIGVSRVMAIRPGVRYVMKGFSSTVNGITWSDNLSYIEIPLMIKARIPLNEVKPYFEAGPTLGIQLSASEDITDGVQSQTLDASNAFETLDFGLYFGSGIEFRVANKTSLFTGIGYSLGLSNISKSNVKGRNYGFQFTAGASFGL